MPTPRLTDDGYAVTLDLHGARVDEAERLLRRVAALAARRGRTTLRVIHGLSTSLDETPTETIKHRVHALLDADALAPHVTTAVRQDGHALLGLALAARRDGRPLLLSDLR